MFELPKNFRTDARLTLQFDASGDGTVTSQNACKPTHPMFKDHPAEIIYTLKSSGWRYDPVMETAVLRETTYKHHKFYVSGKQIDRIQTLAHHEAAEFEAGVDEDGDVYWQVSFPLDVFDLVVNLEESSEVGE